MKANTKRSKAVKSKVVKSKAVKSKTAKKAQARTAPAAGWLTTDEDEIERRRLRGINEVFHLEPKPQGDTFYGSYQVSSEQGQSYRVEIRALSEYINSCECPDHRVNGLGTCKHVEAALQRLQYRRKRAFKAAAAAGCAEVEVFVDRRDQRVRVRWPRLKRGRGKAGKLLAPFFDDDNTLLGEPLDTLPALQRAVAGAVAALRRRINLSGELPVLLETLDRREQRVRARRHFEAEVAAGRATLDVVNHPLYPYQQAGMLHLAFTGRAMLADEMGLGKTVQAVAACELLRRTVGIRRVLVIAPASLKGEWQEQIAKFSELPSHILQGPRAQRLAQYRQPAFFVLANYEQIRSDAEEINTLLAPDVIILDEAQRIKNWQTKTAAAIKRLHSPYAFVLTGTPLENRIDEIYSIVQFLDPALLGPLFRFNRAFYQLDDKGRAAGYKNLDRLHQLLKPVMLRRGKGEVEGQLPGRTVNTYFVAMHPEQRTRYEEYETVAARLAHAARKRPLSPEEMQRLQRTLACMRMVCDTPYILDQGCRVSPKLDELGNILRDIQAGGQPKIIVFSEWQRMLELLREQLDAMGLGYAWHTGQVAQAKRRTEIQRFREQDDCRLFLSTDSGAVGLNLQVASVVINMDLPWNPAKLEQRIARAWRKHQKHAVQVINLVTEDSIEHRMLFLLEQKQALAERVVDGAGDTEMALPSGRAAFLERVGALVGEQGDTGSMAPSPVGDPGTPDDRLQREVLASWQDQLARMELHGEEGAQRTLLVVTRGKTSDDALRTALNEQLAQQFPGSVPQLTLLDADAYASMRQLIDNGVLQMAESDVKTLYLAAEEPVVQHDEDDLKKARQRAAWQRLEPSKRQHRMAQVLATGGFMAEALSALGAAVEVALQALAYWQQGEQANTTALGLGVIESTLVQTDLLPPASLVLIARLREQGVDVADDAAQALLASGDTLLAQVDALLDVQ